MVVPSIWLVVLCAVLAACTKMPPPTSKEVEPDKHIWVTHCEGPAFRDVTKSPTFGGYETGLVVKVTDELILALPKNAAPVYFGPDPASAHCERPENLPENPYLQFTLVLSPSEGIDATTPIQRSLVQDRVWVLVFSEKYGSTVLPAELETQVRPEYAHESLKGYAYEKDIYGLRCYGHGNWCFGSTRDRDTPDIFVKFSRFSGGESAVGEYVSTDYPRVRIRWETPSKNLSRWKEIAMLVATRLREWNTLRSGGTSAPPHS